MPTASHVRKRYAPHLVHGHKVQANRQRGDRLAQQWRDHYDQFARHLGYRGIDQMIDRTQAPGNTGRRHDYDQIARSLGHRSLNALLNATSELSNSELAANMGIAYGTAWRLRHQPQA